MVTAEAKQKPGKIDFKELARGLGGNRLAHRPDCGWVTPDPFWTWAGATAVALAFTVGFGYATAALTKHQILNHEDAGFGNIAFGALAGIGAVATVILGTGARDEFKAALGMAKRKEEIKDKGETPSN